MLKRKGRMTFSMMEASVTVPRAWRQISLPSIAGVVNHSFLRAATAFSGSLLMAAR